VLREDPIILQLNRRETPLVEGAQASAFRGRAFRRLVVACDWRRLNSRLGKVRCLKIGMPGFL